MTTLEHDQETVVRYKSGNRYYRGPRSDHFDGTLFFNPGGETPHGLGDVLRWQLRGQKTSWPKYVQSNFPRARPEAQVDGDGLRVTMVGHATMLIQTCGLNILTDPVWSDRASPFAIAGPKRVNKPGIHICGLPPIDIVLLSHNHYDHMDMGTLKCLRGMHDPEVVTPLGNDALLHAADPSMHVSTLDWGDCTSFRNGVHVHAAPAHHWSARGIKDRRMALWASFVIETPHGNIYHVGDTGFDQGRNYRKAGEKFGGFRLALLPIGAYDPRWFMKDNHQSPEEAVDGMLLAKADYAVGHHWGTFHLANEPVDEPPQRLARALKERGLPDRRFRAMHPGEVWNVPARTGDQANTGN